MALQRVDSTDLGHPLVQAQLSVGEHEQPRCDPSSQIQICLLYTSELSREIASLGIYPAVDPLTSTSRILDRRYISEAHYDTAVRVKQILQRNKELQLSLIHI